MRYASKYGNLRVGIRGQETRLVRDKATGEMFPHVTVPQLYAEFQQQRLRPHEITLANAVFEGRAPAVNLSGEVWVELGGATPSEHPQDLIDPQTQRVIGQTVAFHDYLRYGLFDTEWLSDPDDRKLAEEVLNKPETGLGTMYIALAELKARPPWKTYDQMRLVQGAHNKIPAMVRDLAMDPAAVLAYEQHLEEPKPGVVEALRKMVDEQTEDAEIDASLGAVIG